MTKLEQIEALIAVVEEQGFAAAGRKLGISTAGVSRKINQLEKSLKIELLHRTTRTTTLTDIGKEYYQQCKKIMNDLSEAEAAIAAGQKEAVGILNVTCSRYFAIKFLIPRLSEFKKQNPKLTINLELAERLPDLAKENIDIVFGFSKEGPGELVRKRIAMTRYVMCASPAYFKKFGTPKIPTDLINHQYITHSMRTPGNAIFLKNDMEIFVEPTIWLNDSFAMRECALRDMGIVMLHDYVVNDAIQDKKLIEILKDYTEALHPVFLYYQQSKYLLPKIRRFIDFYTE